MTGAAHPRLIERLKALMAEENMTPAELNRRAGLARTAVGDILAGKVRSPKLETLEALAQVFHVPVAYLIGESDARGEALSLLHDFELMDPEDKAILRALAARTAAIRRAAG